MTNSLPMCPVCEQDILRRLRFRGFDGVYLTCLECDALADGEEDAAADDQFLTTFEAFCREHDLSYPADVFWIDLPRRVGEIIRLEGSPSVVGVITGLADRDGRAYDVEFLDEYGQTTYAGRLEADRFYPASVVWERRYVERRAKRPPSQQDSQPDF